MKAQPWCRVELPPKEGIKNGKADQLQRAFEVMFVTMRKPPGAALFEWFDERLETNVFYFSPKASFLLGTLIVELGGEECNPPLASHQLVFVSGDEWVSEGLERSIWDKR